MAGTGLATAHLTRPVLPLSPRFERGARTQARTYAHGRTVHSPRCRHSRLVKFHSSFIDFYIRLLCIVTFGRKIVGPAGRREAATGEHGEEDGGEDAGRAAEHGAVHAKYVCDYGFACATDAFSFSRSTTCCRHSCESLDNLVVSFMIVLPCSFI